VKSVSCEKIAGLREHKKDVEEEEQSRALMECDAASNSSPLFAKNSQIQILSISLFCFFNSLQTCSSQRIQGNKHVGTIACEFSFKNVVHVQNSDDASTTHLWKCGDRKMTDLLEEVLAGREHLKLGCVLVPKKRRLRRKKLTPLEEADRVFLKTESSRSEADEEPIELQWKINRSHNKILRRFPSFFDLKEFERRENAAIVIQCLSRRVKALGRLHLTRESRASRFIATWADYCWKRWQRRQKVAAIAIQQQMRGFLAKILLIQLFEERLQERAALALQHGIRCMLARNEARRRRQVRAAVFIQRNLRVFLAKRFMKRIKSSIGLQCFARIILAKKTAAFERLRRNSARIIQFCFLDFSRTRLARVKQMVKAWIMEHRYCGFLANLSDLRTRLRKLEKVSEMKEPLAAMTMKASGFVAHCIRKVGRQLKEMNALSSGLELGGIITRLSSQLANEEKIFEKLTHELFRGMELQDFVIRARKVLRGGVFLKCKELQIFESFKAEYDRTRSRIKRLGELEKEVKLSFRHVFAMLRLEESRTRSLLQNRIHSWKCFLGQENFRSLKSAQHQIVKFLELRGLQSAVSRRVQKRCSEKDNFF